MDYSLLHCYLDAVETQTGMLKTKLVPSLGAQVLHSSWNSKGYNCGTPAYLCIAEHLEHICVERFNSLVVASEDLLLYGAQVQRVRHLLIVLAVPGGTKKTAGLASAKHLKTIILKQNKTRACRL